MNMEQKTKGLGRKLWIGLLAAAVCIGLVFLIPMLTDPYDCRIAEGVSIGGLDVGGMTKGEARKALDAALDQQLLTKELVVSLPGESVSVMPVKEVNIRQAVKDAYRYGRTDAPGSSEIALLNYVQMNEDVILSALEAYAAQHNTAFSQMEYHLEGTMPELATDRFDENAPCQNLLLTLGIPRVELDVDGVYGEICAVVGKALICTEEEYRVIINEIAPLETPLVPDVAAIWEEVSVAAVNDSLDMQAYQPVPGSYGYAFDPEEAQQLIDDAQPGEAVTIPMEYVTPEIISDQVYFRDELGHCETKHNTDENRNTNLRLLCAALDGYIIQPGEEFSYNAVVGERTAERGYKPATAYSGTRMVKDIGGGVCQGSTTLYNCALLADLEILERVCHGATVTYIPVGLDAAVNWNTKTDLRFRNNFHFPMMIKAEVSDGYVRMKLMGTDEKNYYIVMSSGSSNETPGVTYGVSYKNKYDKATGELISKDREAVSAYYSLE